MNKNEAEERMDFTETVVHLVEAWVNGNKSYVVSEINSMTPLRAGAVTGGMVEHMTLEHFPCINVEVFVQHMEMECLMEDKEEEARMIVNPTIEHTLKYFRYEHLPDNLKEVSRPFAKLAKTVATTSPKSPETAVALRKLLEAKDAAVRAALD